MLQIYKESLEYRKIWIDESMSKAKKQIEKDIVKAGTKGRTYVEYESFHPNTPQIINTMLTGNIDAFIKMIVDELERPQEMLTIKHHEFIRENVYLKIEWSDLVD